MLYYADVKPFLREKDDLGPHLHLNLLTFFGKPQITSKLQVEMAATVDWGEPFVKVCYTLEGDGSLAFECFKIIDKVKASVGVENIPNVRAVVESLTRQPPLHLHHEQWVSYARYCIKGKFNYFNAQLSSNLKEDL